MINYNMIIILLLYTLIYSSIFKFKLIDIIKSIITSFLLGMIITLLFITFNVYLYVDYYILILIPISLTLYYLIDTRYLCLAYSYPIYVCIVEFFNIPTNCNISSYIFLIGVIHLIEGLLLIINKDKNYNNEIETYDIQIDFKGNVIKCKTFLNMIWIVPSTIPIIVNYQLYEIINIYNIRVKDLLNINNGNIFFTFLFLIITYKYKKENIEDFKSIKQANDSIKLICFAILIILISRLINIETSISNNFQYMSLLLLVSAHEIICNSNEKSKKNTI